MTKHHRNSRFKYRNNYYDYVDSAGSEFVLRYGFARIQKLARFVAKLTPAGLVVSLMPSGLNPETATLAKSRFTVFDRVEQMVFGVNKPTLFPYAALLKIELDRQRGLFKLHLDSAVYEFEVVHYLHGTAEEGMTYLIDELRAKRVAIEEREFKLPNRYNRFVVFLVGLCVIVAVAVLFWGDSLSRLIN